MNGKRQPDVIRGIEDFVQNLANFIVVGEVINPYAFQGTRSIRVANGIRRANLFRYLIEMAQIEPKLMFIGEAPGYQGCRLTGVPFTSEAILLTDQMPGAQQVGTQPEKEELGYLLARKSAQPSQEATATMVWRALEDWKRLPLLWNAFPFHPYQPGKSDSNRPPTVKELALGITFIQELLTLFPINQVVAIGRRAELALNRNGIPALPVRHPSHGGKSQFEAGLKSLAS